MAEDGTTEDGYWQLLKNVDVLVREELKVVTYKWLSRAFSLPCNAAKKVLARYVEQQEVGIREDNDNGGQENDNDKNKNKKGGRVEVIYFVSGWAKTDPKTFLIQLSPKEKLESLKAQLASVSSVHVYSVQPTLPKDPATLWIADHMQSQELFNQPAEHDNCLLDNRYSGVTCTLVKRNLAGNCHKGTSPSPQTGGAEGGVSAFPAAGSGSRPGAAGAGTADSLKLLRDSTGPLGVNGNPTLVGGGGGGGGGGDDVKLASGSGSLGGGVGGDGGRKLPPPSHPPASAAVPPNVSSGSGGGGGKPNVVGANSTKAGTGTGPGSGGASSAGKKKGGFPAPGGGLAGLWGRAAAAAAASGKPNNAKQAVAASSSGAGASLSKGRTGEEKEGEKAEGGGRRRGDFVASAKQPDLLAATAEARIIAMEEEMAAEKSSDDDYPSFGRGRRKSAGGKGGEGGVFSRGRAGRRRRWMVDDEDEEEGDAEMDTAECVGAGNAGGVLQDPLRAGHDDDDDEQEAGGSAGNGYCTKVKQREKKVVDEEDEGEEVVRLGEGGDRGRGEEIDGRRSRCAEGRHVEGEGAAGKPRGAERNGANVAGRTDGEGEKSANGRPSTVDDVARMDQVGTTSSFKRRSTTGDARTSSSGGRGGGGGGDDAAAVGTTRGGFSGKMVGARGGENTSSSFGGECAGMTKKRKVVRTRIDERGREVTEVVWVNEHEEEVKPDMDVNRNGMAAAARQQQQEDQEQADAMGASRRSAKAERWSSSTGAAAGGVAGGGSSAMPGKGGGGGRGGGSSKTLAGKGGGKKVVINQPGIMSFFGKKPS